MGQYFRYSPRNEDGVAARSLPGVDAKGSFFTRGSGHNRFGVYTEVPDEYQDVLDRLLEKHQASAKYIPAPVIQNRPGAKIGVISLGGCDSAVREGLDQLAGEGIAADYMRIRGFPFDTPVTDFLMSHDYTVIIEQNRDAQLRSLLTLETAVPKEKMRSALFYGGFPLSARQVVESIKKFEEK